MRKMLFIIGLVAAAVSVSGLALAYDLGINPSTGTPIPGYSHPEGGGMALAPFNPGLDPQTGTPIPPASMKSYGTTNGIEPYNPGFNPSVVGQSKPGSNTVARKPVAPK